MAEIKSALEIALARTEGIETDKNKIMAKQLKVEGRKAALAFMDARIDIDGLKSQIKSHKGDKLEAFKSGAAESLMSTLKLPTDGSYADSFAKAGEGLGALSSDAASVSQMFEQLSQFFDQYLQNREQMDQQLKAQFAPMLRQKEEALFAQTGQRISIDPLDDPEFQKIYTENIGNLSKNYSEALNQAREQLKAFLEIS